MTDAPPRHRGLGPLGSRKEGIPLGRIAGIPVYLAYSWFVIAGFTVLAVGPALQLQNRSLGFSAYLVAFAYALLLAVSVLVHELAHALSAKAFGWPTEKIVLNLWGGHTQFESFVASPGRSVVVAMAGPAANFALSGATWLLISADVLSGVADMLVNIFMWANFLIAIFNVLPGLPLDGGRLIESAVWKATGSQDKGTIAAGWAGRVIVVGLVFWFLVRPFLQGLRPDTSQMIITVLVCGFLWMGATAAIRQGQMRSRLPRVNAAELAEPAVGVPETATVAEIYPLAGPEGPAIVLTSVADGRPVGVVDPEALRRVPPAQAAGLPITTVAHRLEAGAYVPQTAHGQELIQYLAKLTGGEYAVIDDAGTVTGLLRQYAVVMAITGKDRRDNGTR
ncbi:site-2 protease family protein [Arthrobacter sp. M4]|uniref:site-2 protease family protein n=1 Tax=Arthrobacter sp. M4 TaxID=218160 RepID=UPI001CDC889B|nr:site-2 protease family protein [Arthrobacter sp. M4]MCA4131470.1 site-2 protease family protein [Arthrobacter sp. M4]